MGIGLGAIGSGIANGVMGGWQEKEERERRQRRDELVEQKASSDQRGAMIKQMGELLEMVPDEQVPAFTDFWNQEAPSLGLPPMKGFRRVGKSQYQIQDSGGKLWGVNTKTLQAVPINMPDGGQLQSPKSDQWDAPYQDGTGGTFQRNKITGELRRVQPPTETFGETFTDPSGNTMQRSSRGRVTRVAPAGPEEFTDPDEDEAGNIIQRGDRTGKVSKVSGPVKPDMNPAQAERRITDLAIAKTKVGQGSMVDKLLSQTLGLPEGQQLSDEERQATIGRIDEEIASLQQYRTPRGSGAGGSNRATATKPGGQFKTANDVKKAYEEGKLSREDASKILRTQFRMRP